MVERHHERLRQRSVTTIPIGPANRYQATAEEIPQREYDLDKAKFHLKKAGLDSLDVKLHVAETAFAGATDGAQLYQERRPGRGNQHRSRPRTGGWILVECLAQEALVCQLLGRTPD